MGEKTLFRKEKNKPDTVSRTGPFSFLSSHSLDSARTRGTARVRVRVWRLPASARLPSASSSLPPGPPPSRARSCWGARPAGTPPRALHPAHAPPRVPDEDERMRLSGVPDAGSSSAPSLLPSTCVRPAQVALHPAGHGTARTRPRVACPRSTWCTEMRQSNSFVGT